LEALLIYLTYAFIVISIIGAIYQLALAFSPPFSEYTMGVELQGKLPSRIRQEALT